MTLMVYPYTVNKEDQAERLDFSDDLPGAEMAGFESCRTDLWGHESARSLGLTLLPSLAESDIYAEGAALDALEAEVQKILSNLDALSKATGYRADYIEHRSRNILQAISRARAVAGGVYIG